VDAFILRRIAVLVVAIGIISILHYATDPSEAMLHVLYQRLYYVPIIFGAYWFGIRGGLLTAFVTSLAYVPHIHIAWAENVPYTTSQYAEIVVFHGAGFLVGLLVELQRRVTAQYQAAAASLERMNLELRASQEHLRRAERLSALGEVAAGLAHEIRNPLAGVKGALEIIASRAAQATPEAEFSEIGWRELTRLDRLVEEFLSFARPRHPELCRTSLHEVIGRVGVLLKAEGERAGVTIRVEHNPALPELLIDAEQISQVVFNVVLNGIQATPPGGCVMVGLDRQGDHASIEILDEGHGIAREHLERIFDPFFTTKERGTGLGLAISQRIISAHGGTIEAENLERQGTVVRIRLPIAGEQIAENKPTLTGARG
jgi:two-component system, NtrC family, sensor histidine kinase HydH